MPNQGRALTRRCAGGSAHDRAGNGGGHAGAHRRPHSRAHHRAARNAPADAGAGDPCAQRRGAGHRLHAAAVRCASRCVARACQRQLSSTIGKGTHRHSLTLCVASAAVWRSSWTALNSSVYSLT